jgi:hypothetical protein
VAELGYPCLLELVLSEQRVESDRDILLQALKGARVGKAGHHQRIVQRLLKCDSVDPTGTICEAARTRDIDIVRMLLLDSRARPTPDESKTLRILAYIGDIPSYIADIIYHSV